MNIAVIGAGNWGTALSVVAARAGHDVILWSRNASIVASIRRDRVNPIYLSGAQIPKNVRPTHDLAAALTNVHMIILAAPSHALRNLLMQMGQLPETILVSAAKGIEFNTGKRISQIVKEFVASDSKVRFVCLSGPSFAKEVVEKHPTAIVAASADRDAATEVQAALSFENLRIYTNSDVVGTEIGGSVKNVMAIAAGMVAGLGFGSNSIAALITRGLAEVARLAIHEGARIETLMGLAGLGDLVLTCTGNLSRNRYVGVELGKGRTLDEITSGMNEIAEGIFTTKAVKQLAEQCELEMPITEQVHAVLYEGKQAQAAVADLMHRPLREELSW